MTKKLFILEPAGSQELDAFHFMENNDEIRYVLVESEEPVIEAPNYFSEILLFVFRSKGHELEDEDDVNEKLFNGELEHLEIDEIAQGAVEWFESKNYSAEVISLGRFYSSLGDDIEE
jgi:hypothetical protein